MRLLVVTEKCGPDEAQRDGGARLVASLRRTFGDAAAVAQFGERSDPTVTWHFTYPPVVGDRFQRRLALAPFVAARVREVAHGFTDVLYVHTSMLFESAGHAGRTWLFPMFLTPSYIASGESVPCPYTQAEREALARADRVLTPSHLERRQLTDEYGVEPARIRVIPRGVERALFAPRIRTLEGPPVFCSIGSIKRQKNTLGLLRLFVTLRHRHPGARLRVIGPVQDKDYAEMVRVEVARLGLEHVVQLVGYVPPEGLSDAIRDTHLHLSAATYETFGRATFETLASGLPNVARSSGNAAVEFLGHAPYARFVDTLDGATDAVSEMLTDLPRLSRMASETGEIFDDAVLSGILAAEIAQAEVLAIADWDGTLYHKTSPERTGRSIKAFNGYARRMVCSARGLDDLLAALASHDLHVDWIVASSGAVAADARGNILWRVPIEADFPCERSIAADGEVVQLEGLHANCSPALRIETYQGVRFATDWRASKLSAIVRLIREVGWRGRVRAFGDGPYDEAFLAYFDGTLVGEDRGSSVARSAKELACA